MNITRRQLRTIIKEELRLLNEESEFDKAMSMSSKNPKVRIYYYDKNGGLIQVLLDGVIEDTLDPKNKPKDLVKGTAIGSDSKYVKYNWPADGDLS